MYMSRPHYGVRILALAALIFSAASADAAPLGVYDGNGTLLGTYLGSDGSGIQFVTRTGYVARVLIDRDISVLPPGRVEGSFIPAETWTTSDCSGSPLSDSAVTGTIVRILGATDHLGYVPRGTATITLPAGSTVYRYQSNNGTPECVPGTISSVTVYVPAMPNDPSVTGIEQDVVTLPITLAFVDGVFASGFDQIT
jgi:hypothetical protein